MNIIVVCSDTFRYDHLGFIGRHPVLTPNLDKLARESASFSDFQLCSFPTVVNRIEVFSGRCAFPRVGWGPLPYHYPVMSQVFKRHGFTTALVADNVQVMKKEYHFDRGFDFVKHVRGQQHDDWLPKDSPQIELPCSLEKIDASPKRLARYRRNAHWRQRNSCFGLILSIRTSHGMRRSGTWRNIRGTKTAHMSFGRIPAGRIDGTLRPIWQTCAASIGPRSRRPIIGLANCWNRFARESYWKTRW